MPKQNPKSNNSVSAFTPIPSHFLSNPSVQSIHRGHFWKPPTDVYETEKDFIVSVEIAGMTVEDFAIQFHKQFLIIQGKRNIEFEKCALHQIEIYSGEFQVSIEISAPINQEISHIEYHNGFLTVSLPKLKNRK
jgi:HSP20 family molecular chaperone IbpA